MTRKSLISILGDIAFFAAFLIIMAAFLRMQAMPYPIFENLNFGGWLLLSASIVAVTVVPGLAIFGIYALAKWLLVLAFQRRPEPTPPNPPAPAAVDPADIEDEWANIRREIAAEWAEAEPETGREKK